MKEIIKKYPQVVIIGRTNVGKSTLFNCLIENKKAIVSNIPGTTRDQRTSECLWQGQRILLSDTAGLDVVSEAEIDKESIKKTKSALTSTDIIFFVVDAKDGILPQDKQYASLIKKTKRPTILVINKVDSKKLITTIPEFYSLGFRDVVPVSAKTGAGTGDLLDLTFDLLKKANKKNILEGEKEEAQIIKIALIGKPNVGKSSLLNKIIGEDKAIVSSLPHTTRDSQDICLRYQKETDEEKTYHLTFIDTAGIIKKRKINNQLNAASIKQSLSVIKRCDLIFLIIDASREITQQDKNISGEILEKGKSLIFVINKWDLVQEKTTHSDKEFMTILFRSFPYLTWAPVIFVSAKTGSNIERLINSAIEIFNNQHKEVTQKELDKFLQHLIKRQSPKKTKGLKPPYIYKITQRSVAPLTFELTAKGADNIHFSYQRFIINELREKFNYKGCGINLIFTEKK